MTQEAQEVSLLGDWLSWTPENLVPSEWGRCLPLTAWLFDALHPELVVELGTGSGASFRALCQVAGYFSRSGRLVGVDEWRIDPLTSHRENPLYTGLREFCSTRSAHDASLMRLHEGVDEFEHSSIDLLHIANGREPERQPLDLSEWATRVRPGGVILLTSDLEAHADDVTRKEWRQISEWFPAEQIGISGHVGVAQLPIDGRTPLIDTLRGHPSEASALFRSLGERMQYRHVLGSEPVSCDKIRAHLARLQNDHANMILQLQAGHGESVHAIEAELTAITERLLIRSREAENLQAEADRLLARLASRAGAFERHGEQIQEQYAQRLSEIDEWHAREHDRVKDEFRVLEEALQAEVMRLHLEVKIREEYIAALTSTMSWRVTRGLRLLQRVRMRLAHLVR